MATKTYNLYQAKTSLSKLVDQAAKGQEIIIAKDGVPMARLMPLAPAVKRKPGGWEGQVRMADDFDAELPPEVLAGFEGGADGEP